jgi:hypothetical protein
MDTMHADQAFNNDAEKHMLQTIKRAILFDEGIQTRVSEPC